jgi:NO-binding membrane sensor protein with MHYT domain
VTGLPAHTIDMLAFSKAFNETFGLLATFIGIGIIVNVLIVYIVVQVRGERQRNEEMRAEHRRRLGS